tara:strand:- start:1880 stop:2776 length:897 start_codon:yes stop_codon:yes gene_type:complete
MAKRQRFRNVPKDKETGREVQPTSGNILPEAGAVTEAEVAAAEPIKDQGNNIADGITKHGQDFITGAKAFVQEPVDAVYGKETPIEERALSSLAFDTLTGKTTPEQGWGEFHERVTERPAQVAGEAASYAIPFGAGAKLAGTAITKAAPQIIKHGSTKVDDATKVIQKERDYLPDPVEEKFVKNIEDGKEFFGPSKIEHMKLEDNIYYKIGTDNALTKKDIAFLRAYEYKPPGFVGPLTQKEYHKGIPSDEFLKKFPKVGEKDPPKKPDTIGQGFSESDMYGSGSRTKDSYKGRWPWG